MEPIKMEIMPTIGILSWIRLLILWTWLPLVIVKGYQTQQNYMNPAYNPGYNPSNDPYNPLTPSNINPAIFERCKLESMIPMAIALGDLTQFSYMCSSAYFRTCQTTLPVALITVAGVNPYQRDYIMSTVNAWVKGGAPYLCNIGQSAIRQLMLQGGSTCLQVTAASRIRRCDIQLASLTPGLEYSDLYCHDMDNDLQCYIDAVNVCPDNELRDFLWDFFQNVMYESPCRDISKFTNAANTYISNCNLLFAFTALTITTFYNFLF